MAHENNGRRATDDGPLIEGEDFYREGAAIVFTARYHLRRGYCCGSGCRHCPYEAEGGKRPAGEGEEGD